MTKEMKQEFTRKITQANKTGLVVILYEMTLYFLESAAENFDREEFLEYQKNIGKAKECLDELLTSLDKGYEPAARLQALYYFYKRQLTSASVQRKKELLLPVMGMIKELKESYEKIAAQDTSAPLMENTQEVYAGLTYGRGSLNENLADQGSNRGFRI